MAHIKTFENFLNEGMQYNPKPFSEVKPGDIAQVSGDPNKWEVVTTAYGREYNTKLKPHDKDKLIADMKASLLEPGEFASLEFVVVKHRKLSYIYTYDEDGAWVNK